jgi:hypothetical protein
MVVVCAKLLNVLRSLESSYLFARIRFRRSRNRHKADNLGPGHPYNFPKTPNVRAVRYEIACVDRLSTGRGFGQGATRRDSAQSASS